MKIIGCGNPDRGDDRAGVLVAERLRELGIAAETHTGELLALIEAWDAADDVILIDAVVTGAPPGTVHMWDGRPPRVLHGAEVSTHGLDLAQIIELAQALGRLPARLRLYGIEARQFDPGSSISPEVHQAVESVVRQITAATSKSMPACH